MTNILNPNKVWIEIKRSDDKEENQKRAKLFTNMIHRLRGRDDVRSAVWWCEEKNRFAYSANTDDHDFLILNDDGHWFNLDLFGRD